MELHDHTYAKIQQSHGVKKLVIVLERASIIECACQSEAEHFFLEVSFSPCLHRISADHVHEGVGCLCSVDGNLSL